MESLTFAGDAFSEYYLRHLLWDEPKLRPLLGLDTVDASYRRAAAEVLRSQRNLRERQQARSTRTLLLTPLADILGWQLGDEENVETAEGSESAGQALIINGRTVARVLAIGPDSPMDLPATGVHRRFAPTLSIVRVLEELGQNWGIVLNAYELRLICRAEGFVSSHVGFDLTSIAEGRKPGLDAWRLLWALLRNEALSVDPTILDRVVANSREHQEGVSAALGGHVRDAIVAFVQGIVSNPANNDLIPRPIPQKYLNRLYAEALRVLYRILFALYAEARNLLPLDLPTYRDGYSLTRLARQVTDAPTDPRRNPTTSGRYFEFSLRALFELLRRGANLGTEGRIPMYDGALFDHASTELVESLVWGDETIAIILEKLTRVPSRTGLVRLSYRELDVEQLGAVYESLLEQVPQIASETMYRVKLGDRETVVTAEERRRLAERRGEIPVAGSSGEQEEESLEGLSGEEDAQDQDSGDEEVDIEEEEGSESQPTRRGSARPLRVLDQIAPGTVYLKAGMGRKQTGSFYTARPLVEFLVRRTIDPLAEGKTPEEILALKIIDPAMGSGHFLVGACRRLAEHLLAAYRKHYEDVSTAQPALTPGDAFLEAGVHPEVAANWEHEDRAITACRLLVAGNCIYGVDKNPLAVDLARVSLWLATAAMDHPLTFLDHRLRVGDSLLGLTVYIGDGDEHETHLLKPDEPARRSRGRRASTAIPGLLAGEIVTEGTRQLRQRIGRAMLHLGSISELMNERPGDFGGHRAAFEAMQGELEPFTNLHALRIGRDFLPSDTPAEVILVNQWLSEIADNGRPSDESRRMAEPFIQRGRELGAFCWHLAFPEVFFTPEGRFKERPGFDVIIGNPPWDKIKPNERECFSDFDPTVWDVQGQERRRLISRILRENEHAREVWERHETETKTLAKLLLDGGLYHHQIAVVEGKKTGGDPDMFKFFAERAWQLLRPDGRAGMIVPLGIQGSLGTTGLRRLLLDQCRLSALIKLDNERYIFPGVFHGQKFDLLVFAKGGRAESFDAAFFSWEPADVVLRLEDDPRHLVVDAELYRELSPEQYTFVELHDQSEVELLRRIYRQFPRLGEHRNDTWNVSFTAEFHMTNDSFLFRDAARLKAFDAVLHSRLPSPTEAAAGAMFEHDEDGEYWTTQEDSYYRDNPRFAPAERWVSSRGRVHLRGEIDEDSIAYRLIGYVLSGEEEDASALPVRPREKYIPLYEGRMVHQFDHCQKAYVSGSGRRARWIDLPWQEKRIVPHYYMSETGLQELAAQAREPRPGICLVTGQTNERTTLVGMIPGGMACGHAFATAKVQSTNLHESSFLVSSLNSFVLDWILRLQVSNNIGIYHLYGLPFPGRNIDNQQEQEQLEAITKASARLICFTPELNTVWNDMAENWPEYFPLPWTRERACLDVRERSRLRADIDARMAMLYGLNVHEYARILSTFPLLDQDQPRLPGDFFIRRTNRGEKVDPRGFITRDLALLTFFELSGQEPPTDIVAFFAETGVDIERNTGPIRDLRTRMEEATRRGAVAYLPTLRRGWRPADTPFLPPDLPPELVDDWGANIGNYVSSNPQINNGEPTLAGTRIALRMIYDLLNQGWTFAQILESYPHLNAQQVAIALRWGDLQ